MSAIRRMFTGLVTALALAAAAPAWSAGATAPPPTAENLALAKRYIAAIHMDRQMDGMMANLMPVMTAQIAKGNANITPAQQQAISEAAQESAKLMMGRMMDRMTPIFAQTFTTEELKGLVTFYEGPVGQSMMAKTPALMKNMGPMLVELMPQMQEDMRQRLCAKTDCSALAKPAAAPPKAS